VSHLVYKYHLNQNLFMNYFLILDFEANVTDKDCRDHEICEFPSVLISSADGKPISEFQEYVKGVRLSNMSEFATSLTGITDVNLQSALPWSDVVQKYSDWLNSNDVHVGNTIVITCGDWDLKSMWVRQLAITKTKNQIPDTIEKLFSRWINIKILFQNHMNVDHVKGMAGMLRSAGLPLIGRHHSGIDDCRNIASICKFLIERQCVFNQSYYRSRK
jgi:ERI1 exoribonuclease 3